MKIGETERINPTLRFGAMTARASTMIESVIELRRASKSRYEVILDGDVIGTIHRYREPIGSKNGEVDPKAWGAHLLGYKNYTWIGRGKLEEIAGSLVDHEREQRIDNPKRQSRVLRSLLDTANPEYQIEHIENVMPFKCGAELIGTTAGRLYFREQTRLVAVTASKSEMERLRAAIDAALEAGPQPDAH